MTTLSVNQNNALKLLADAFSARTTFVTELMQNARRAGATEIRFGVVGVDLTVTDDGCGIDDFSKLLTLCESGWSQDVQDSDAPYGVGFLSAIMASSEFTVTSNGKTLYAVTDELLAGVPATISEADTQPGTLIKLRLRNRPGYEFGNIIHTAARTFPINVYLNNLRLWNPVALNKAEYKIEIDGLGTLVWDGQTSNYLGDCGYALQGLPIGFGLNKYSFAANRDWVVHLDQTKFRGRMPDRETVIWQAEYEQLAGKVLEAQKALLLQCWMEHCKDPSLDLYVLASHELGREYLDMVETIPAGVFRRLCEAPERALLEGGSLDYTKVDYVTRGNSTNFRYISDFPDADDGNNIAALRVLYENDIPERRYLVPSWIMDREIGYYDVQVEYGTYDTSSDEFTIASAHIPPVDVTLGHHYSLTVQPCEAVRVTLVDEDDNAVLSTVETNFAPTVGNVLYLVGGSRSVDAYVFQQDINFVREDSEYEWDYDKISYLCEKFTVEYELAQGKDPIVLVKNALAPLKNRISLGGKSYAAQFGMTGGVTVTPADDSSALLLEAKQVLIQIGGYACELPDVVSGRLREFLRKLGADL